MEPCQPMPDQLLEPIFSASAWERRQRQLEDSPVVLQRFRDEYLAAMTDVNIELSRCTRNSHNLEALELAIGMERLRDHIGIKLCRYIFGPPRDDDYGVCSYLDLARRVSTGEWVKDLVGRGKVEAAGEYIL
jgi:hypothetical protein